MVNKMKLFEERVHLPNEFSSLKNTVSLHGVVRLQHISQVLHLSGQRDTIQCDGGNHGLLALGEHDALGLRLLGAELEAFLLGKFLTNCYIIPIN